MWFWGKTEEKPSNAGDGSGHPAPSAAQRARQKLRELWSRVSLAGVDRYVLNGRQHLRNGRQWSIQHLAAWTLEDVYLNTVQLECDLGLPCVLLAVHVGKIDIRVPWQSLWNQSAEITLTGIQIELLDVSCPDVSASASCREKFLRDLSPLHPTPQFSQQQLRDAVTASALEFAPSSSDLEAVFQQLGTLLAGKCKLQMKDIQICIRHASVDAFRTFTIIRTDAVAVSPVEAVNDKNKDEDAGGNAANVGDAVNHAKFMLDISGVNISFRQESIHGTGASDGAAEPGTARLSHISSHSSSSFAHVYLSLETVQFVLAYQRRADALGVQSRARGTLRFDLVGVNAKSQTQQRASPRAAHIFVDVDSVDSFKSTFGVLYCFFVRDFSGFDSAALEQFKLSLNQSGVQGGVGGASPVKGGFFSGIMKNAWSALVNDVDGETIFDFDGDDDGDLDGSGKRGLLSSRILRTMFESISLFAMAHAVPSITLHLREVDHETYVDPAHQTAETCRLLGTVELSGNTLSLERMYSHPPTSKAPAASESIHAASSAGTGVNTPTMSKDMLNPFARARKRFVWSCDEVKLVLLPSIEWLPSSFRKVVCRRAQFLYLERAVYGNDDGPGSRAASRRGTPVHFRGSRARASTLEESVVNPARAGAAQSSLPVLEVDCTATAAQMVFSPVSSTGFVTTLEDLALKWIRHLDGAAETADSSFRTQLMVQSMSVESPDGFICQMFSEQNGAMSPSREFARHIGMEAEGGNLSFSSFDGPLPGEDSAVVFTWDFRLPVAAYRMSLTSEDDHVHHINLRPLRRQRVDWLRTSNVELLSPVFFLAIPRGDDSFMSVKTSRFAYRHRRESPKAPNPLDSLPKAGMSLARISLGMISGDTSDVFLHAAVGSRMAGTAVAVPALNCDSAIRALRVSDFSVSLSAIVPQNEVKPLAHQHVSSGAKDYRLDVQVEGLSITDWALANKMVSNLHVLEDLCNRLLPPALSLCASGERGESKLGVAVACSVDLRAVDITGVTVAPETLRYIVRLWNANMSTLCSLQWSATSGTDLDVQDMSITAADLKVDFMHCVENKTTNVYNVWHTAAYSRDFCNSDGSCASRDPSLRISFSHYLRARHMELRGCVLVLDISLRNMFMQSHELASAVADFFGGSTLSFHNIRVMYHNIPPMVDTYIGEHLRYPAMFWRVSHTTVDVGQAMSGGEMDLQISELKMCMLQLRHCTDNCDSLEMDPAYLPEQDDSLSVEYPLSLNDWAIDLRVYQPDESATPGTRRWVLDIVSVEDKPLHVRMLPAVPALFAGFLLGEPLPSGAGAVDTCVMQVNVHFGSLLLELSLPDNAQDGGAPSFSSVYRLAMRDVWYDQESGRSWSFKIQECIGGEDLSFESVKYASSNPAAPLIWAECRLGDNMFIHFNEAIGIDTNTGTKGMVLFLAQSAKHLVDVKNVSNAFVGEGKHLKRWKMSIPKFSVNLVESGSFSDEPEGPETGRLWIQFCVNDLVVYSERKDRWVSTVTSRGLHVIGGGTVWGEFDAITVQVEHASSSQSGALLATSMIASIPHATLTVPIGSQLKANWGMMSSWILESPRSVPLVEAFKNCFIGADDSARRDVRWGPGEWDRLHLHTTPLTADALDIHDRPHHPLMYLRPFVGHKLVCLPSTLWKLLRHGRTRKHVMEDGHADTAFLSWRYHEPFFVTEIYVPGVVIPSEKVNGVVLSEYRLQLFHWNDLYNSWVKIPGARWELRSSDYRHMCVLSGAEPSTDFRLVLLHRKHLEEEGYVFGPAAEPLDDQIDDRVYEHLDSSWWSRISVSAIRPFEYRPIISNLELSVDSLCLQHGTMFDYDSRWTRFKMSKATMLGSGSFQGVVFGELEGGTMRRPGDGLRVPIVAAIEGSSDQKKIPFRGHIRRHVPLNGEAILQCVLDNSSEYVESDTRAHLNMTIFPLPACDATSPVTFEGAEQDAHVGVSWTVDIHQDFDGSDPDGPETAGAASSSKKVSVLSLLFDHKVVDVLLPRTREISKDHHLDRSVTDLSSMLSFLLPPDHEESAFLEDCISWQRAFRLLLDGIGASSDGSSLLQRLLRHRLESVALSDRSFGSDAYNPMAAVHVTNMSGMDLKIRQAGTDDSFVVGYKQAKYYPMYIQSFSVSDLSVPFRFQIAACGPSEMSVEMWSSPLPLCGEEVYAIAVPISMQGERGALQGVVHAVVNPHRSGVPSVHLLPPVKIVNRLPIPAQLRLKGCVAAVDSDAIDTAISVGSMDRANTVLLYEEQVDETSLSLAFAEAKIGLLNSVVFPTASMAGQSEWCWGSTWFSLPMISDIGYTSASNNTGRTSHPQDEETYSPVEGSTDWMTRSIRIQIDESGSRTGGAVNDSLDASLAPPDMISTQRRVQFHVYIRMEPLAMSLDGVPLDRSVGQLYTPVIELLPDIMISNLTPYSLTMRSSAFLNVQSSAQESMPVSPRSRDILQNSHRRSERSRTEHPRKALWSSPPESRKNSQALSKSTNGNGIIGGRRAVTVEPYQRNVSMIHSRTVVDFMLNVFTRMECPADEPSGGRTTFVADEPLSLTDERLEVVRKSSSAEETTVQLRSTNGTEAISLRVRIVHLGHPTFFFPQSYANAAIPTVAVVLEPVIGQFWNYTDGTDFFIGSVPLAVASSKPGPGFSPLSSGGESTGESYVCKVRAGGEPVTLPDGVMVGDSWRMNGARNRSATPVADTEKSTRDSEDMDALALHEDMAFLRSSSLTVRSATPSLPFKRRNTIHDDMSTSAMQSSSLKVHVGTKVGTEMKWCGCVTDDPADSSAVIDSGSCISTLLRCTQSERERIHANYHALVYRGTVSNDNQLRHPLHIDHATSIAVTTTGDGDETITACYRDVLVFDAVRATLADDIPLDAGIGVRVDGVDHTLKQAGVTEPLRGSERLTQWIHEVLQPTDDEADLVLPLALYVAEAGETDRELSMLEISSKQLRFEGVKQGFLYLSSRHSTVIVHYAVLLRFTADGHATTVDIELSLPAVSKAYVRGNMPWPSLSIANTTGHPLDVEVSSPTSDAFVLRIPPGDAPVDVWWPSSPTSSVVILSDGSELCTDSYQLQFELRARARTADGAVHSSWSDPIVVTKPIRSVLGLHSPTADASSAVAGTVAPLTMVELIVNQFADGRVFARLQDPSAVLYTPRSEDGDRPSLLSQFRFTPAQVEAYEHYQQMLSASVQCSALFPCLSPRANGDMFVPSAYHFDFFLRRFEVRYLYNSDIDDDDCGTRFLHEQMALGVLADYNEEDEDNTRSELISRRRMAAVSICGTDMRIVRSAWSALQPFQTMKWNAAEDSTLTDDVVPLRRYDRFTIADIKVEIRPADPKAVIQPSSTALAALQTGMDGLYVHSTGGLANAAAGSMDDAPATGSATASGVSAIAPHSGPYPFAYCNDGLDRPHTVLSSTRHGTPLLWTDAPHLHWSELLGLKVLYENDEARYSTPGVEPATKPLRPTATTATSVREADASTHRSPLESLLQSFEDAVEKVSTGRGAPRAAGASPADAGYDGQQSTTVADDVYEEVDASCVCDLIFDSVVMVNAATGECTSQSFRSAAVSLAPQQTVVLDVPQSSWVRPIRVASSVCFVPLADWVWSSYVNTNGRGSRIGYLQYAAPHVVVRIVIPGSHSAHSRDGRKHAAVIVEPAAGQVSTAQLYGGVASAAHHSAPDAECARDLADDKLDVFEHLRQTYPLEAQQVIDMLWLPPGSRSGRSTTAVPPPVSIALPNATLVDPMSTKTWMEWFEATALRRPGSNQHHRVGAIRALHSTLTPLLLSVSPTFSSDVCLHAALIEHVRSPLDRQLGAVVIAARSCYFLLKSLGTLAVPWLDVIDVAADSTALSNAHKDALSPSIIRVRVDQSGSRKHLRPDGGEPRLKDTLSLCFWIEHQTERDRVVKLMKFLVQHWRATHACDSLA